MYKTVQRDTPCCEVAPLPEPTNRTTEPPQGVTPEQWQNLTADARDAWPSLPESIRRELLAISRPRPDVQAARSAALAAESDPDTNASVDLLIAARGRSRGLVRHDGSTTAVDAATGEILGSDVATPRLGNKREEPRHAQCGVPLVGRKGSGRFIFTWQRCKTRTCGVCADSWKLEKLNGLGVVLDALAGGTMDSPLPPLYVGTVTDEQWRATSTRLRRHGAGWVVVPQPDGARLVATDDPTFGPALSADAAVERVSEALTGVSLRKGDTRQVRFSGSWRELIDAATLEPEALESDVIEWGVAPKAKDPAALTRHARRAGGVAGPMESDADSETWLAKVPPSKEWAFLGLIGWKTMAEVAAEKARRREFDSLQSGRWKTAQSQRIRAA